MMSLMRFDWTHQKIRAIDLVTRSTVRVVRLCDGDVVERTHERSKRGYRGADQRPCQPYLNIDGWRYEGEALVCGMDRL